MIAARLPRSTGRGTVECDEWAASRETARVFRNRTSRLRPDQFMYVHQGKRVRRILKIGARVVRGTACQLTCEKQRRSYEAYFVFGRPLSAAGASPLASRSTSALISAPTITTIDEIQSHVMKPMAAPNVP